MWTRPLACAFVFSTIASAAPSCDRACMMALVDQYLAAVVKHDPSGLPLSPGVRFYGEYRRDQDRRWAIGERVRGSHHVQDLCSRSGFEPGGVLRRDEGVG
jgi:hypothetical protein